MTFSYDYLIGTLLIVISLVGIFNNIISFCYFRTRISKSNNALYFQRLYMVITLTDTAICLLVIPVINAALSDNRDGALFKNETICRMWATIWSTLPQLSIYMVGVLSVSRLVVLVKPTRQLHPSLAVILPALCLFALVTTSITLLVSGVMHGVYIREWLGCTFTALTPGASLNRTLTQQDLDKGLLFTTIYNIIPAASIVPISISFTLSLYYLKKSSKKSVNIATSYRRQLEAAKTVILVTLLYIIFNIPYSGALVYRLLVSEWTLSGELTVQEYLDGRTLKPTTSDFFNAYFMPMVCVVSVSMNSMVNPAVYFCRITNFRNYVKNRLLRPAVLKVERSISKNSVSREQASKVSRSRSLASKDSVSRDLASRDLVSKDSASRDMVSKDLASRDMVSKDSASRDVSFRDHLGSLD